MFKSANIFRITPDWPSVLSISEDNIAAQKFQPCAPSQEHSAGWVPPRGEENGAMIEAIDGQWILMFQIEKKTVPGALLKRRVAERAADIEKQTGRKPGKRERKELKEDILMELLPMAFPALKQVPVWINTSAATLVIGTTSSTQADLIVTAMVKALEGFAVEMYNTQKEPGAAMSAWLSDHEVAPEKFSIGRTCEMRQLSDGGAVVRYKNHPLDVEEVAAHAKEMSTTSLHLTWDDRVSFALHDDLSIRSIAFLEGTGDAAGKPEDNFDADVAIATGELKLLLADLTECLGGLAAFAATSGPEDAVATAARAFDESMRNKGTRATIESGGKVIATFGAGPDPLYEQALELVRKDKRPSISLVQRHLKIGYNRAAGLLEAMEAAGAVSAMDSEGKRAVL